MFALSSDWVMRRWRKHLSAFMDRQKRNWEKSFLNDLLLCLFSRSMLALAPVLLRGHNHVAILYCLICLPVHRPAENSLSKNEAHLRFNIRLTNIKLFCVDHYFELQIYVFQHLLYTSIYQGISHCGYSWDTELKGEPKLRQRNRCIQTIWGPAYFSAVSIPYLEHWKLFYGILESVIFPSLVYHSWEYRCLLLRRLLA